MTIRHLVLKEVLYRKLNFGLGLLSVATAIACLIGALHLLRSHDSRTEGILKNMEQTTALRMRQLEDDYRKITKKLGFNILILPKEVNLSDLYADDYAARYMPEDYAQKLAESPIISINHLLPTLEQKIKWPERKRTIILIGVRGEVPLENQAPKKPLLESVPPGTAVLGYELHKSLDLSTGDVFSLLGRKFKVHTCHPERGSKDDITIWINLKEAQELLHKQGLINAIWALECNCSVERLPVIREEIAKFLPDTQVIEKGTQATVRAEARLRAAQEAEQNMNAVKEERFRLRRSREAFAAVLVPLVMVASGIWVCLLAFGNVRERRSEIGIWRTIGFGNRHILSIFLLRAGLIGLVGGAIGYAAGFGFSVISTHVSFSLLHLEELAAVLVAVPVMTMLASWPPAQSAAQQDPAVVLRGE